MSSFRTVEISNTDANGLCYLTVKSENLRGRGDISVYIPKGYENTENLPLVILLHGVYGSHWAWAQKGKAHETVQKLIDKNQIQPMALAMPSDGLWGDGSGYLPHHQYDFEKWITHDVPTACIENFSCFRERSPLFLAGLSMGGYGALRIGAKNPNLFKAFSGLSSIVNLIDLKSFSVDPIPTDQLQKDTENVIDIMLKYKEQLAPFRFDCGIDDALFQSNKSLSKALETNGIPHIFEALTGDHEWPYWEKNIEKSFLFFSNTI